MVSGNSNFPDWYREDDDRRMLEHRPTRAMEEDIRQELECEIFLLTERLDRLRLTLEQLDG